MKPLFSSLIIFVSISNLSSQVKIELLYNNGDKEIISNPNKSFHTKLSGYQTSLFCRDESTWNSRTYASVKWIAWYSNKNRRSFPLKNITRIELEQSIDCENHIPAAKSRCFPLKIYL